MSIKISFLFVVVLLAVGTSSFAQKSSSVLASGEWVKLAVFENGVYKVDRDFLSKSGFDVSTLNPKQLAIYGNANNGMLPQLVGADRADDLLENAIQVSGEADGKFDSGDELLFYGRGPDHVSFDQTTEKFKYEKHLYSDTAFYFLTVKSSNGLRIAEKTVSPGGSATKTYKSFQYHEWDDYNKINSGRFWYGELFHSSQLMHSFEFASQGLDTSYPVEVDLQVLSTSLSASSFTVSLNGNSLGVMTMDAVPTTGPNFYAHELDIKNQIFNHQFSSAPNSPISVDLLYAQTLNADKGYLDYILVTSEKKLDLANGLLEWSTRSSETAYQIAGSNSKTRIWDVSNHVQPSSLAYSLSGSQASFGIPTAVSELIAFNDNQTLVPFLDGEIKNQNLHALSSPDGIIITDRGFVAAATRLANFRMQNDGLIMEVVTVDGIYNEYASGAQDITALRDFVKHLRNKNPETFKYVLLFGDTSFDYKDRGIVHTNFVPIYQSRNSVHQVRSYGSDDYIGFLDDDEGMWVETSSTGDHVLDVGIGRIPIRTNEEGEAVVNKLIRYETNPLGFGPWKNNIVFVADDGDGGNPHQHDAERLVKTVKSNGEELVIDKLFIDAFPQENNTSPTASQALLDQIDFGNFLVNYTGHGNTLYLAHEKLFSKDMIAELDNNIRMPFFVSATCDFGKYDAPNEVTGGEQLFLLPYGGVIGTLTSTRKVFGSTNFIINDAFYDVVFEKVNHQYKRLGDIVKETKNESLRGYNNRNYALLGDPSMKLGLPDYEIDLTHINDLPIGQGDTLSALGEYSLRGQVALGGQVKTNFSGKATITIFDKPTQFVTLDDEETGAGVYDIDNVILFRGEATVKNGLFEIDFIIPKNINYSFDEGRMSLYAVNSTNMLDAHGSYNDAVIGGSVKREIQDKTAPGIELYMEDSTFTSGQAVGINSLFIAKITDESGINLSSLGFSDQLLMTLDEEEPVIVSRFYTSTLDTYKEGTVMFPLKDLSVGKHTIHLEASDIFNNQSSASIEFYVTDKTTLDLLDVYSYPNPVTPDTEQLTFVFNQDRLGEDLAVTLEILNMQGKRILAKNYRLDNIAETKVSLFWDMTSSDGRRIDNGLYFYRLKVKSVLDGSSNEVYNKILILK